MCVIFSFRKLCVVCYYFTRQCFSAPPLTVVPLMMSGYYDEPPLTLRG